MKFLRKLYYSLLAAYATKRDRVQYEKTLPPEFIGYTEEAFRTWQVCNYEICRDCGHAHLSHAIYGEFLGSQCDGWIERYVAYGRVHYEGHRCRCQWFVPLEQVD